jgi:hypothetical protein
MATATVQVRTVIDDGTGTNTPAVDTTDAADLNLLSDDLHAGQTASDYPIWIPETGGGTNYSYERWFLVRVTAMNDSSVLENFRVWASTATPITGDTSGYTKIKYSPNGTASFTTPVDTASTEADTDIPTADPTTENLYIGGAAGGSITTDGSDTDYMVLQLHVGEGTPLASGSATIYVAWDETA